MPSQLLPTVLLSLRCLAVGADEPFSVVLDLDRAGFQSWFDSHKADHRPMILDAYTIRNEAKFAVVSCPKDNRDWQTRLEVTGDELREKLKELEPQRFMPTSLAGYVDSGGMKYAASWMRDGGAANCVVKMDLAFRDLQDAVKQARSRSLRPYSIRGYPATKGVRYSLLLEPDEGAPWQLEYNLTASEYQRTFDRLSRQEYRPVSVCGYWGGSSVRYAACFVRDRGVLWAARHDLDAEGFAIENAKHRSEGYLLTSLAGYPLKKNSAFAAVWSKGTPERPLMLPPSGTPVPELKAFDDAMLHFMRERSIPCGTLAIGREGKLVYARGFGYRDRFRQYVVQPSTPFRLASVSKPITAAAVRQFVDAGKLELAGNVCEVLGLKPTDEKRFDPRWRDVTIQHLLSHRGGWDRKKAFDPMFRSATIMKELGRQGPAAPQDVIDYMLLQPMQSDPGSTYAYSNFGYCLLGRVVEKLSGRPYVDYVQQNICKPLGITSLALGRSLPADRNPDEPVYTSKETGRNVFHAEEEPVPAPDGGFHLEAMDSHGGLVASAPDLMKFLHAYWIDGTKRISSLGPPQHQFGSLSGTWTLVRQRSDGVVYAALFNQRTEGRQSYDEEIVKEFDAAVDSIKAWPNREVSPK